jgi:hypothetical protein
MQMSDDKTDGGHEQNQGKDVFETMVSLVKTDRNGEVEKSDRIAGYNPAGRRRVR